MAYKPANKKEQPFESAARSVERAGKKEGKSKSDTWYSSSSEDTED